LHPAPMAALTVFLASCLFCLAVLLAAKLTSPHVRLLLVCVAGLISIPGFLYIFYYAHLMDGAVWFYNLRIRRNTELLAAGLGFLAGIIYSNWKPETPAQKATIPLVTLVALFIPFLKPLLDPLNYATLKSNCPGEVCLQSTPSTCGPSSAATILKMYGDPTSERELAENSFTSHGGTEIWYLARALQRRGYATQVLVQPAASPLPQLPAIAGVVLPGGAGHFIAMLSESNGQVTLADPLDGKHQVSAANLRQAYHFTGFFLTIQR
jgi:Peptidase C39 family